MINPLFVMRKIRSLSEAIISKIAAGEVIERPVYAVKELVENSIDAGATSITVQIEESGLKSIAVLDNGEGMSKDDLEECFKPHTTSKLSSVEHLSSIRSFGFRGEALSSIAAISRMHIKSRTKHDTAGTSIELLEGKIKKIAPVGMPEGTQVTVYNLFYPVPARKKFLKSSRTEFRHIVELMTQFAFFHPEISFTFSHNGKTVFDLPATTDILQRIRKLLGEAVYTNLLPLAYDDSYVTISGFLVKPQMTSSTTHKQYLSVNKRGVTDKLVSLAVKDAYGTLLESVSHPMYVLFITTPYEAVDVNVHPRKENIRFVDNQLLYDAVHKAVAQTLQQNNLTFFNDFEVGIGLADGNKKRKYGYTQSVAGKLLKENQIPWDIRTITEIANFSDSVQMHDLYLVASSKNGIIFVDQHAAHERILYEQFLKAFKEEQKKQPQFHLQKPIFIDVSFSDSEILKDNIPLFEKFGFTVEHYKDNAFFIHAVPLLFQDRNIAVLLSEMLADILLEKRPKDIDRISQRMIAYLACRAAVKAGERLTKKQTKDLLEKLEKTPNKTTCPHGRPTTVVIDLKKIHAMFKRK